MRIAQVSPLYEAVPPRLYGGTERVVAHLSDALVELGHDVTLFTSAEAQTKARLVPVRDQALRLDPAPLKSDLAAHMSMLWEVRQRAHEFDVIHFHTEIGRASCRERVS
jgi:glycosyltransferase involved in cell wall biosynthesis